MSCERRVMARYESGQTIANYFLSTKEAKWIISAKKRPFLLPDSDGAKSLSRSGEDARLVSHQGTTTFANSLTKRKRR